MESTQEQTTETAPQDLNKTSNTDTIDAIGKLLSGSDEPEKVKETPTKEPESESITDKLTEETERLNDSSESKEPIEPPKNLNELAEKLGIEVKDLYDIEFPASNEGESHTIGELKDLLASESDFSGRDLELSERVVKFESDQMKARQELEIILKSIPKEALTPEVLAKAQAEMNQNLERETVRTLDVIPTWNDAEVKRVDMVAINEHMESYGFSKSQVELITDHRMLKYMRDNSNRNTLVQKALGKAKPVKKVAKGQGRKPTPKRTVQTATPKSSLNDQVAAISNLL